MKPGERWTQAKYDEMNERYQRQTMDYLRKLAAQIKPFFLQDWPLIPMTGPRTTEDQYTTSSGTLARNTRCPQRLGHGAERNS